MKYGAVLDSSAVDVIRFVIDRYRRMIFVMMSGEAFRMFFGAKVIHTYLHMVKIIWRLKTTPPFRGLSSGGKRC